MNNTNSPEPKPAASTSVYEARDQARGQDVQFVERPVRNPFMRPSGDRRINLILALAVLITLSVAAWLTYVFNRPPSSLSVRQPRSVGSGGLRVAHPDLLVTLSPSTAVLVDELADLEVSPPPTDHPPPLNVFWLKQAAYHIVMGEKAYSEERLAEALQHFEACLDIYPEIRGAHRYLGLIHLKLKNYDRAAQEFEKVGQEEGLSAGVANNIGVAYLALNMFDSAEKYLKEAIRIDPDYANAYLNLAMLAERRNDREAAAAYMAKYLRLRPTDLAVAQAYAALLMDLNRWAEAIPWLEKIRDASPDLAPVYFRLAIALAHAGHHKAAFAAIDRGIQLMDPQKALAWLSEPDFDPLRREPAFRRIITTLSAQSE
ncbi:MAG: hypothetical protein DRP22_00115 [Verrucomicrobia bacterium]|nr:MAG: hypothetical protein DRP22_00115 [Verrucomicrobiota bacterium]